MASDRHGFRRLGLVSYRLRLHQPDAVYVPAAHRPGRLQRTACTRRHQGGEAEADDDVSADVRDDVRIVGRSAAHYRDANLRRNRLHRLPGTPASAV